MGSLSNLATPSDVKTDVEDRLGGYVPLDSGLYKMNIDLAFLKPSPSGAIGFNIHYSNDTGQTLRETLWVVSGDAKGNRNYYTNQKGEKHLLPGMQVANALCERAIGKELSTLDDEEKVISLYDPSLGAETPTKVRMVTDLLTKVSGKQVILGVKRNVVDKNVKNDAGEYVPSGETREENVVDKVFSADNGMTRAEQDGGSTDAVFIQQWEEKWKGVTTDRSTKNVPAANVPGGTVNTTGAAAQPTKSLFGK